MVAHPAEVERTGRPCVLLYRKSPLPFSETFVLNQVTTLQRYEPVLVGLRDRRDLDISAVRSEFVSAGRRRMKDELLVRVGAAPSGFLARLRAHEPTLVHAHFGQDALEAIPLARRLDVPLVVTLYGYDVTMIASLRNGLAHLAYRARLPAVKRHADLVLTVSDFLRERALAAGFPPDRLVTHYVGVDPGAFTPRRLEERAAIVLAVGRFVEKKGFPYLIDAMRHVQQRRPGTQLVFAGKGPLEPSLRRQVQDRGVDAVFAGVLASSEVSRLMASARVLAVPSVTAASGDTEGLPFTVLEGMACGTPVVATRHAGIPEAVEDGTTGYLVPERDVGLLAERIGALLADDASWHAMSAAGRARVLADFNLHVQTSALEDLYDRVRAGRTR